MRSIVLVAGGALLVVPSTLKVGLGVASNLYKIRADMRFDDFECTVEP